MASAHAGVSVEEPEQLVLEFRELLGVWESLVILQVVVQNVHCVDIEQLWNFLVGVELLSEVTKEGLGRVCLRFFEVWVHGLVPDSCVEDGEWQEVEDLRAGYFSFFYLESEIEVPEQSWEGAASWKEEQTKVIIHPLSSAVGGGEALSKN